MPGVFGFIKKEGFDQSSASIFELMCRPLRHLTSYHEEKHIDNHYGFGSISVGNQKRIFRAKKNGDDFIVLIDGYIYSVRDQAGYNSHGEAKDLAKTILQSFQIDDELALLSLEGNYTIAVYNQTLAKLTIFNDIIGPRRMYYADLPEAFVFSSESKAITAFPGVSNHINWKGIADFLNYGYILGNDTFFSDIWSLSSATILTYDENVGTIEQHKYWQPEYTDAAVSFEETVEGTYTLLCNSIEEKISNEPAVISPISGGLDSRIILGILKDLSPQLQIKANTHGQKFSNEYKFARQVCKALEVKDHHLTEILPRFLNDKYKKAVWYSEGMVALTNAHLLLTPEKINSFDLPVLTGIYGGPTNYSAEYFAERHLEQVYTFDEKIADIASIIAIGRNAYSGMVPARLLESVEAAFSDSIAEELASHEAASDRFCNQRDAFFIENRMRRMICQADLFRFYWEEHLPLSNYALYKFYLSVPPEFKIGKKILKQMLKDHFKSLARIKDANTGLNLFEDKSITHSVKQYLYNKTSWYVNRLTKGQLVLYDKSTYSHYGKWLQRNAKMFDLWQSTLLSEKMNDLGLIEPQQIMSHLENTRKTSLGFYQLARLTTLAMWCDMFVQ